MSTIDHANALWGRAVVARALAHRHPTPMNVPLAELVAHHAAQTDDSAFARWALSLPLPTFAAVVRLAAGLARKDCTHD